MMSIMCDERVAEAVRKYPAIYDKTNKYHKNKEATQNAWERVVEEADVESVDVAKRLFENLRKRFQRRRRSFFCRSDGSGDSKEWVSDMAFLMWLEPHIIPRNRYMYTSLGTVLNKDELSGEESNDNIVASNEREECEEEVKEENAESQETETDYVQSSEDVIHIITPADPPSPKRKKVESQSKDHSSMWNHQKSSTNNNLRYFRTENKTVNRNEDIHDSKNLNYAKYIASEIDQLPEKLQRVARHEISNILYNVQCQADSSE